MREGDDVLDEGCVGALTAVTDCLGPNQLAVDHLVYSSEQLRLSSTASIPTFFPLDRIAAVAPTATIVTAVVPSPTVMMAGATQKFEELLAEPGTPPCVDNEICR